MSDFSKSRLPYLFPLSELISLLFFPISGLLWIGGSVSIIHFLDLIQVYDHVSQPPEFMIAFLIIMCSALRQPPESDLA